MSTLSDLKKAKRYSDVRQYDEKHQLLHRLVRDNPQEFYIDSEKNGIVGLTHDATGFRIHVPKNVIGGLKLESRVKESAATLSAGSGMPKLDGGGQGSYIKLPSLYGNMKSELTKATKQVGENAKAGVGAVETPNSASSKLYPATTKYMQQKLQPSPYAYKKSDITTSDVSKALGYSPGFWYDKGSFSPAAETRMGNLISGIGLSGLGLASIPVLQYMFPERFKGKGKMLAAASILGGMAAPWAINAPSTMADISRLSLPSNDTYTDKDQRAMQLASRTRSGIRPQGVNAEIAEGRGPGRIQGSLNAPAGQPSGQSPSVDAARATAANSQRYYVGGHFDDATGEYVGGAETDSTHTRAIDPNQQALVDSIRQLRESMAAGNGHRGGPGVKSGGYIPMDLQIAKTHLANVAAEQMRSGYVDYGQAASLMMRASEESSKPWVTVRDLAHAAIGAGAGAVSGTIAAKGIGLFVNLSPTERKVMQGTGAALGTLLNLGKFGF